MNTNKQQIGQQLTLFEQQQNHVKTVDQEYLQLILQGNINDINNYIMENNVQNHNVFSDQTQNNEHVLNMVIKNRSLSSIKKYQIIQFLLQKGINVNLQNNLGQTPLFIAALYHENDIFNLLSDNGANVRHKDSKGNNILTYLSLYKKADDNDLQELLVDQLYEQQIKDLKQNEIVQKKNIMIEQIKQDSLYGQLENLVIKIRDRIIDSHTFRESLEQINQKVIDSQLNNQQHMKLIQDAVKQQLDELDLSKKSRLESKIIDKKSQRKQKPYLQYYPQNLNIMNYPYLIEIIHDHDLYIKSKIEDLNGTISKVNLSNQKLNITVNSYYEYLFKNKLSKYRTVVNHVQIQHAFQLINRMTQGSNKEITDMIIKMLTVLYMNAYTVLVVQVNNIIIQNINKQHDKQLKKFINDLLKNHNQYVDISNQLMKELRNVFPHVPYLNIVKQTKGSDSICDQMDTSFINTFQQNHMPGQFIISGDLTTIIDQQRVTNCMRTILEDMAQVEMYNDKHMKDKLDIITVDKLFAEQNLYFNNTIDQEKNIVTLNKFDEYLEKRIKQEVKNGQPGIVYQYEKLYIEGIKYVVDQITVGNKDLNDPDVIKDVTAEQRNNANMFTEIFQSAFSDQMIYYVTMYTFKQFNESPDDFPFQHKQYSHAADEIKKYLKKNINKSSDMQIVTLQDDDISMENVSRKPLNYVFNKYVFTRLLDNNRLIINDTDVIYFIDKMNTHAIEYLIQNKYINMESLPKFVMHQLTTMQNKYKHNSLIYKSDTVIINQFSKKDKYTFDLQKIFLNQFSVTSKDNQRTSKLTDLPYIENIIDMVIIVIDKFLHNGNVDNQFIYNYSHQQLNNNQLHDETQFVAHHLRFIKEYEQMMNDHGKVNEEYIKTSVLHDLDEMNMVTKDHPTSDIQQSMKIIDTLTKNFLHNQQEIDDFFSLHRKQYDYFNYAYDAFFNKFKNIIRTHFNSNVSEFSIMKIILDPLVDSFQRSKELIQNKHVYTKNIIDKFIQNKLQSLLNEQISDADIIQNFIEQINQSICPMISHKIVSVYFYDVIIDKNDEQLLEDLFQIIKQIISTKFQHELFPKFEKRMQNSDVDRQKQYTIEQNDIKNQLDLFVRQNRNAFSLETQNVFKQSSDIMEHLEQVIQMVTDFVFHTIQVHIRNLDNFIKQFKMFDILIKLLFSK